MHRRFRAPSALLGALLAGACTPGYFYTTWPADACADTAACRLIGPLHEAGPRQRLADEFAFRATTETLMVVRYVDGHLTMLPECNIAARYRSKGAAGGPQTWTDEDATFLRGEVGDSYRRELAPAQVSFRAAKRGEVVGTPAHPGSPECMTATHFVREIVVGDEEAPASPGMVALRLEGMPRPERLQPSEPDSEARDRLAGAFGLLLIEGIAKVVEFGIDAIVTGVERRSRD